MPLFPQRTQTPGRAAVAFIFVTVALDMLAFGIIAPVLPKLIVEFEGGNVARASRQTVWPDRRRLWFRIHRGPGGRRAPRQHQPPSSFLVRSRPQPHERALRLPHSAGIASARTP